MYCINFNYKTDSNHLLCNFHREQSWNRWCSKINNGVLNHKTEVLNLLRAIAKSKSVKDFEYNKNSIRTVGYMGK